MAEVLAEVRVVIHAHDGPAAHMDHGELAIRPAGSGDLVVYLDPPDAERWLSELAEAIRSATVAEGL